MKTVDIKDVDSYIASFPAATRELLEQVRTTIQKAAPKAEETIGYQMPAYKLNGSLVYFAGYKNHIGFYPTASGIAAFKKDLNLYKNSKGSIQFPLNKPLPLSLIRKIVKYRVEENKETALNKKKTKVLEQVD